MNDTNRLLLFLLLAGLLYALYRYQHIIFGQSKDIIQQTSQQLDKVPHKVANKEAHKEQKKIIDTQTKTKEQINSKLKKPVSIDNISQASLGSLDNEDGNQRIYKVDSILGSLKSNTNTINDTNDSNDNNSAASNITGETKDSFFF